MSCILLATTGAGYASAAILFHGGNTLSLKVIHQGNENVVADDTTALIGSDASATVRIVRPGISRKHAVVSNAAGAWKVEDAGSRNGTFKDGKRIQTIEISGPTTLYLGHPTDGEAVSFVPVADPAAISPAVSPGGSTGAPAGVSATTDGTADSAHADDDMSFDLPATPPPAATAPPPRQPKGQPKATPASSGRRAPTDRTRVQPASSGSAVDVELAQLTAAIRDQISAVKGLTWSVWAMIAVTAALIVLTLFVGILSN